MLIGDVLLVTGDNKLSSGLVAAQKAIYKNSISSHVELGLGDGTFVHATGDGGVHVTFILDELVQCKDEWRAIRLKGISEDQQEELGKAGLYFLRQDYNKIFMGSGNDHSSFCSELIAKVYEKAGISILNGKKPSKVAPAHFDKEADQLSDWEDVTDEYKKRLKEIEADPFPYRLACGTIKASTAKRHITSGGREAIFKAMEMMAEKEGNPRLKEIVDEVKKDLREKRVLHFWDENDQN